MIKLNNLNLPGPLSLLTIVIGLTSCKKVEPPKFFGENFLYFTNVEHSSPDGLNSFTILNAYQPERKFSFLEYPFQIDTLETNLLYNEGGFPLSVQTDGKLTNNKRNISLVVEGNGKEFAVFPHLDSMYIPANGVEYILHVKMIRPPLSDTGMKTLTIRLKNNDQFSPENHVWSTITYKFGNSLKPPLDYELIEEKYGEFSPAKMYALQYAVNKGGAGFWNNDTDAIILNSLLKPKIRGLMREVNFGSFSLDELYYFMQLPRYVQHNFLGSPFDSVEFTAVYNALTTKIISLAKDYITAQKTAGTPILDETGKEVFFP